MRIIYLITAALFAIIGLIISFTNVATTVPFRLFFAVSSSSMTISLILMLIVGAISGFLFGMAFMTKTGSGGGDEEDGDMFE